MLNSNGINKPHLVHNCPLCSSYNLYLMNRRQYQVGICRECYSLLSFTIQNNSNTYDYNYYQNNYVERNLNSASKFDHVIERFCFSEYAKVLDYGAGVGDFATTLINKNLTDVCVYDNSSAAYNFLSDRFIDEPSVNVLIQLKDERFDAICLFDVLAHVEDAQDLLIELSLVNLLPDGKIFIRTPLVNKITALIIISIAKLTMGKLDGPLFHYKTRNFIASRDGANKLFRSANLHISDFYFDRDPIRMAAPLNYKNVVSTMIKKLLFVFNNKNSIVHKLKYRN